MDDRFVDIGNYIKQYTALGMDEAVLTVALKAVVDMESRIAALEKKSGICWCGDTGPHEHKIPLGPQPPEKSCKTCEIEYAGDCTQCGKHNDYAEYNKKKPDTAPTEGEYAWLRVKVNPCSPLRQEGKIPIRAPFINNHGCASPYFANVSPDDIMPDTADAHIKALERMGAKTLRPGTMINCGDILLSIPPEVKP